MTRAVRLAFGIIVLVPLLARGQAPGSSTQEAAQQPVFRTGVELVRLDVRILDPDGRPVTDIRPEEIEVYEGDRRVPLVLFQHVAEPAGTYLEVARRTVGAEVSTNQGAPRGHLYVLVFDQQHITAGNEQRSRLAAERFLRTRVKPGDRVALYAIPGPGPQLPFSSNVNLAISELPRVRGSLDRTSFSTAGVMSVHEAYQVTRGDQNVVQRVANRVVDTGGLVDLRPRSSTDRAVAAGSADSTQQVNQFVLDNARTIVARADADARTFLLSLADIVRTLSVLEGRKTIVLVSEGFYADNISRDIERVAAAAAEAYATVYSLDVNRRGMDVASAEPAGGEPALEIQSRLEPLATLASETDGELVIDANSRIDQAFAHAADVSQDYYLVGFEAPPDALADRNRYRKVSVRVTRPGARVSARTGYSLREAAGPADRRLAIDLALTAPFPQQAVPIELTTYVLRGASPAVQRVIMSLQADLPVAAGDEARPADVVFVAKSARDGRTVASGTDVMPLPRAAAPGWTTARGSFRLQFDAPAGEYLMRVVVREPGGMTGSVDRRFDVRPLDGVDITASDLIVGHRSDALPVRATGYIDDGLAGTLEIYGRRAADLAAADVTLDLFPADSDAPARSIKADLLEIRPIGSTYARNAQVALPLTGVSPGPYIARATVRSRGETAIELVREVTIVGGASPPVERTVPIPATIRPEVILGGDLARRLIGVIQTASKGTNLEAAAEQAAAGAWAKARQSLDAESGADTGSARTLRGLAAFAAESYDLAVTELEAALELEGEKALTSFVLGWAHAARGRDTDAISAWRGAVAREPTLVSAYLALADMYVKLGHPELAAQALAGGLRAVPGSPELTTKLAELGRY